jgi:hypothetical protein
MFYNLENTPENSLEKDFFLINNFLKETPKVVSEIADMFQNNAFDETDNISGYVNIKDVIITNFGFIINDIRDFKIEQVTNTKEIYTKLTDNGLTNDSLYAKLQMLDWLWFKTKDHPETLRSGLNDSFYTALIKLLKSILLSILKAIGLPFDIYEEALELLNSFKEMGKEFKN